MAGIVEQDAGAALSSSASSGVWAANRNFASTRVDGDGVVMVLLWRIEDPLHSERPGADQHAQRKRAHDRDPRPLASQSAGKPARGPAASAGWI